MTFYKLCVILFVLVFAVAAVEKARYDNYRVYTIIVENQEQLSLFKEIESNPDGVSRTFNDIIYSSIEK